MRSLFKKDSALIKFVNLFIISIFFATAALSEIKYTDAAVPESSMLNEMVNLSAEYSHPVLKGLRIDPKNPLNIDFIIDTANDTKIDEKQASRLIRYFLAAITIPKEELWVNLSPYETDRIVTDKMSVTDLGTDMLEQDFFLKQLSSSLTFPETELGKKYWSQINGSVDDSLNKIWIVPNRIGIFEKNNTVYGNRCNTESYD